MGHNSLFESLVLLAMALMWAAPIADAEYSLASTRFELVKRNQAGSFPQASIIQDLIVKAKPLCSSKCFKSTQECWGFEFNSETGRCRLVKASTPTDYQSFTYSSNQGTYVYWSTPQLNICKQGPSGYGEFAEASLNGVPTIYGGTTQLGCKKGSAFNSDDLVAMNLSDAPTTAGRFRKMDLTCGRLGMWYPLPGAMPACNDFVECLRTSGGAEYFGTKYNTTSTGTPCINWSDQTWDTDPWLKNAKAFPMGTLADQKNYCRNPTTTNRGSKPWCFINDANTKWEYCDIPACQDATTSTLDCKFDSEGFTYLGTVSTTTSGDSCYLWFSPPPAPMYWTDTYLWHVDSLVTPIHTHCRNPGRKQATPFCFTTFLGTFPIKPCTINFCPGYP